MQLDLFDHATALCLFPSRPTHPLVVSTALMIHRASSDDEARPLWGRVLHLTFDPLHRANVPFNVVRAHALSFKDAVQAALDLLGPDDDGTPQGLPAKGTVAA